MNMSVIWENWLKGGEICDMSVEYSLLRQRSFRAARGSDYCIDDIEH